LLFIRYLGKQDQIWAKFFFITKNMHYRTLIIAYVMASAFSSTWRTLV